MGWSSDSYEMELLLLYFLGWRFAVCRMGHVIYFTYKLLFPVYLCCFQIYVEDVTFYLDVKTLQCLLSFLAMIGSRLFNSEKESIKSS